MIFKAEQLYWNAGEKNQLKLDWKRFSKSLLNASPNGIAALDMTLKIMISNQLAQTGLDLFPGAMLSTTLPDLSKHAQQVLKADKAAEGIIINRNNVRYSVLLNPIRHRNAMLGIFCIFQDMTALEKITSQMQSFQDLSMELDTIIDSSNDGLWICDGEGTILRLNPASEYLTHVKSDEVLGRNISELVAEGLIDQSVTLEVLKTQKKVSILQQTRHGKILFLTGNPVFDSNGNLFRVVVNERDITEIKSLQEELEEKVALNNQYRQDLLEMQIEEMESRQIIAKTPEYINIIQQAVKLGTVDSTVLILGESGTGKGVVADLIHKYSPRKNHPMIKLNCGSIPESLVESELFGYEKGAFTGAGKGGKPGKFEMAHKGIIFLDEIAELPLSSQVKLLRFLEDGQITRVGGTVSQKVDVRIVAATNRNLKKMVARKQFRSDLFYRLNVIPLTMLPLRKRRDCILPLINHFTDQFCRRYGKKRVMFSREAMSAMLEHPYPGNVREMINICERVVVMSQDGHVNLEDLPASVREGVAKGPLGGEVWHPGQTLKERMDALEKEILEKALKFHGTQAKMAHSLGLNQSTVARKLKKHLLK
ncbi:PAS domain S-box-containing protein [Desulfocicer vacuolatum DSM 3385]|uniref:HTH-type transcriptional regulatory protein TyrR n=1 Tax=Desulfocicer vacuolatum DSM 3385 TaxID=1121400 RepID=A0A1W2CKR0_9BACT|nr:sigma 54-interacting transcriptional regulator [Desulfocicer vacuolatum]SMC85606.1 PAS domain S-box-containing protein [Desulfocicer vacuolatum DSM 3385]